MKKFTSILILFLISFSINAQEFKFENETIDYGKITKGADGEKIFVFTNIGNQPLIITNIKSSCGCTIPKKPEGPIMPGKKGEIKVSYDTNRVGGFSKSITIFSNAKESRKIIKIKGIVNKEVSLQKEKSMLSNN
tara:strand:- start:864 stop:1268 length:405 start_codon:yes stop_codon:yes gene_type:complete